MAACKFLFISAPIGAGHIMAARAAGAAVLKQCPEAELRFANVFDFFSPWLGQTILKVYLKILQIFPALYGRAYQWGNDSRLALFGRQLVSRYLAGRMEQYIKEYDPAVIVCTHATPAGLVAELLKRGRIKATVAAVVTDFVVHRLWVYPEIRHYIVANTAMRDWLIEQGISAEGIRILGIPVQEKFTVPVKKLQVMQELGLAQDRHTILLMGGGAGLMPMAKVIESCVGLADMLQFIVVTGHNTQRYHVLCRQAASWPMPVKVLGYADNVHELMAGADLVISKPGGVTAAEALCCGAAMIIYRPIPGQEEANTRYLTGQQAAVRADSTADIPRLIAELLADNSAKLQGLKQRAKECGAPAAAEELAAYLLKLG